MRLGELLAMRWKSLDRRKARYHVVERIYKGLFDVPQSESSLRWMDLPPVVLDALKNHRAHQTTHRLRMGKDYQNQDLIFCTPKGNPQTNQHAVRNVFKETLTSAGCPSIWIHDLRHTYASLLIAQGESPKYIQRQLGHASIRITFDLYGHLMPEVHQEAPRRLEMQVFGEGV